MWQLDQLDSETLDWLGREFGYSPFTFFRQIRRSAKVGRLVPVEGLPELPDDVAEGVPPNDARFTFIAGKQNQFFLHTGQQRTYERFAQRQPGLHHWVPLGGYSHLDVLIGRRWYRDVFPHIRDALVGRSEWPSPPSGDLAHHGPHPGAASLGVVAVADLAVGRPQPLDQGPALKLSFIHAAHWGLMHRLRRPTRDDAPPAAGAVRRLPEQLRRSAAGVRRGVRHQGALEDQRALAAAARIPGPRSAGALRALRPGPRHRRTLTTTPPIRRGRSEPCARRWTSSRASDASDGDAERAGRGQVRRSVAWVPDEGAAQPVRRRGFNRTGLAVAPAGARGTGGDARGRGSRHCPTAPESVRAHRIDPLRPARARPGFPGRDGGTLPRHAGLPVLGGRVRHPGGRLPRGALHADADEADAVFGTCAGLPWGRERPTLVSKWMLRH